jgi:FixJ family two-component response regulator
MQGRPLIGVLDDEPQFCKALGRLLKTHGFEVVTFALGEELLAARASRWPDCLLLDLHMPGLSGCQVLERLAIQRVPMPVVVVTGHDQPGNAERVRALGAVEYLLKPLSESQLLAAIDTAMKTTDRLDMSHEKGQKKP